MPVATIPPRAVFLLLGLTLLAGLAIADGAAGEVRPPRGDATTVWIHGERARLPGWPVSVGEEALLVAQNGDARRPSTQDREPAGAILLLAGSPAPAAPAITAMHAWSRPGIPNRPMAAYVALTNAGGEADRLTGVASPAFEAAELHAVSQHGEVMRMSRVEAVEIPAGETVTLAPGGLHIMLIGPAERFAVGDAFPLILRFEKAGKIEVSVSVERRGPTGDGHGQGHGQTHSGHGTN